MPDSSPTAQPAPEPRYSQARVIDRLLSIVGRAAQDHSSVTVARNAKGAYQFEVVVRTGEHGADTLEQATAKAQTIVEQLEAWRPYPEPEGGGANGA